MTYLANPKRSVNTTTSTAYHPQTDSQTEHVNKELEGYLQNFIGHCQDDWDKLLPLSKFAHNDHVDSLTQQSPVIVNTGRNPHMGFEPQEPRSMLESINDFTDHMGQGLDKAKVALTKAIYDMSLHLSFPQAT
jgi:hypothetical protein